MLVNSFPGWGGVERYVVTLARGLTSRGHAVTIACRPRSWVEDQLAGSMVRCVHLAPRSSGDLRAATRTARHLRRERYDVIHLHKGKEYVPLAIAARLSRTPLVITRHELFPMSRHSARAARTAACWMAVSDAVRRVLVENLHVPSEQVVTLHTGIDLSRYSPLHGPRRLLPELGLPADDPVFGMITRLLPSKGCDTFVHAAALLKQTHPNVRYLLVGEGPERDVLRALIAEQGLTSEFMLAGFREDIHQLLPELTAMISASHFEPFTLAILEAMGCGVPVLATAAGGSAESVKDGDTGRLFPVGDYNALAQAMRELVENPARASEMGAAGRRRAEELFSQDRMLEAVENVYSQVIRKADG